MKMMVLVGVVVVVVFTGCRSSSHLRPWSSSLREVLDGGTPSSGPSVWSTAERPLLSVTEQSVNNKLFCRRLTLSIKTSSLTLCLNLNPEGQRSNGLQQLDAVQSEENSFKSRNNRTKSNNRRAEGLQRGEEDQGD